MISPKDLDIIQSEITNQPQMNSVVLNYQEIKNLLTTEYSEMLQRYGKHHTLYRGIKFKHSSSPVFISSGIQRKSEDHINIGNFYTVILDNDPRWSEFPKRSESFICASEKSVCTLYGIAHYVFPINGAKIGVCPKDDIWSVKIGGPPTRLSFSKFNQYLSACCKLMNLDLDMSYDQIKNLKFDSKRISELANSKMDTGFGTPDKPNLNLDDKLESLRDCFSGEDKRLQGLKFMIENVGEFIDKYFDPFQLGFELLTPDIFRTEGRNECWTNAKSLMMRDETCQWEFPNEQEIDFNGEKMKIKLESDIEYKKPSDILVQMCQEEFGSY